MTLPCFDEMTSDGGEPRALYNRIADWLEKSPPGLLDSRRQQAEMLFRRIGITFAVYGEKDASERLIPFDIIPRLLGRDEWRRLEAGLIQRVKALNLFLTDIYGAQEILRAGIIPEDLVFRNPCYRPEMQGRPAPHNIWTHISGIDIVRVDDHDFYVLEDNVRTPSGVSYMLENR
ncbi:circularly permuted type 2 ATP-grasp protein, partial [uncultured Rhodoblastus sp.]|uniref:circularly permuted type 2 ATP-grasp protein n=1 Tax=uncultured Rhodoblastus sp. TaxID=543037 RepID=UPI0025E4C963